MFMSSSRLQGINRAPVLQPEPSVDGSLVSMLMYMNGANSGTSFPDFKGHTITRNGGAGGPVTSTAQSKYLGSSGLFASASSQYLSTPNGAEFAFGTGDFLVEGWFYFNSIGGAAQTLVGNMHGNDGSITWAMQVNPSGNLQFQSWTTVFVAGSTVLTTGQWYHLACSRVGPNLYVFVNGIQVGSASAGAMDLSGTGGAGLYIGFADNYFNGYMSNLRIVKGQGISNSFAVPTGEYPNPNDDPSFANVSCLLHLNGPGNTFPEVKGQTMIVVGSPTTSSAQFRFGGASMLLNGTSDYLVTPVNAGYGFGTGDFTMECWAYFNGNTAGAVLDMRVGGGGSNQVKPTLLVTGGNLVYYVSGAGRITTAISTGVWYAIAVTRSAGVTRMFINGAQVGANYTDANDYGASNDCVMGHVGDNRAFAGGYLSAYLDEIRITKGVARYTANYTPLGPFPDQ